MVRKLAIAAAAAISFGMAGPAPASPEQGAQNEMKLFAFVYRQGPAWEEGRSMREQALGPHAEFMQRLMDDGRLLAAGPLLETNGGLAVIRARDRDEAAELLAADPAIAGGIFTAEVNSWFVTFDAGVPLKAAD
ncbi:YCII-related [Parvibaculum lavamentivorans DS-1]|uniref:YCII-related n=1 Tax=Parvibaculum lavamentivorans (strain DS-1 / DSM 13023 / NCIMB 13966) TaxID=402881 RepID=A7HWI3_PARL1|nr:YciI family protein [Parvibaculum lavamentivorans]ABS64266.1 YCII-related [Parvibaculum lavamentivorans DS-1]